MATFKAEVYAHHKRADGTWNIKIRITHQKNKKYVSTPFYIYKEDLTRNLKQKNQYYIDECDKIIRRYRTICDRLGERISKMNVEQIFDYITNAQEDYFDIDIVKYGRDIAKSMHESGHDGNAHTYVIAINNLVKFVGREKISIREITVSFIKAWIKWIQEQPAPNKKEKGNRSQSWLYNVWYG
ncbi:MAG: phage integrase SAM-like domain-containing protein [Bacteroidales bacterium]|nr:phage integrase SAM-like domain-containing protein [Bacteroidales bacterium]